MKKIKNIKMIGIVSAIFCGVASFIGELNSQKEAKRIDTMDERILALEKALEKASSNK